MDPYQALIVVAWRAYLQERRLCPTSDLCYALSAAIGAAEPHHLELVLQGAIVTDLLKESA
jgi:hypothetical protein